MKRSVSILGSTGSIGTQALEVCEVHGIEVKALAAKRNEELLEKQVRKFKPKLVCLYDENAYRGMKIRLADLSVQLVTGMEGLCEAATLPEADMILNSVVGMIGLQPTLAAIHAGKDIALANKETLVTGGELVMKAAAEKGVKIYPVDSEHSAIFQCLQGYSGCRVNKILLTASGGPFFGKTRSELEGVTVAQTLKHPNWSMGAKITVDSATLMNKGFECIEAVWLFGVRPEQVEVVVHRESVIHSMVEFEDYAVLGQMGVPDMKIPIQYALTYPARVPGVVPELDFTTLKLLTFDVADEETFRCLAACKKAIKKGGLGPCAANGANEEAVKLFLEDKIGFLDIGRLVEAVVDSDSFGGDYTLAGVYECDKMARAFVRAHL